MLERRPRSSARLAIALTAVAAALVDRRAGLLLLPYLAWVAFATALNYDLWRLNR